MSKLIVPSFGNYLWDREKRRLYRGFASNIVVPIGEDGLFRLVKNGKPSRLSSKQLDELTQSQVHKAHVPRKRRKV